MKAPEILISTFFALFKYKLSSPEATTALGDVHFIGSAYMSISNLFSVILDLANYFCGIPWHFYYKTFLSINNVWN